MQCRGYKRPAAAAIDIAPIAFNKRGFFAELIGAGGPGDFVIEDNVGLLNIFFISKAILIHVACG